MRNEYIHQVIFKTLSSFFLIPKDTVMGQLLPNISVGQCILITTLSLLPITVNVTTLSVALMCSLSLDLIAQSHQHHWHQENICVVVSPAVISSLHRWISKQFPGYIGAPLTTYFCALKRRLFSGITEDTIGRGLYNSLMINELKYSRLP